VEVVAQIEKYDSPVRLQLFQYLQRIEDWTVSVEDTVVREVGIDPRKVILLKQGIWEHKYPFRGFVLVRNSLSVYASLKRYDEFQFNSDYFVTKVSGLLGLSKGSATNKQRLIRWMRDIDRELVDYLSSIGDIERFCAFYNRRFAHLASLGLPVVHYERLVQEPTVLLSKVLHFMGLTFDTAVLRAHEKYRSSQQGHGRTDLSRPIDTVSTDRYKMLDRKTVDTVCSLTYQTLKAFGYQMNCGEIEVRPDFRDGFLQAD
jgi:hypothetical protein